MKPAHFRTSPAVMAQRTEPADSLDFFPTPPWATRAAIEHCLPLVWWDFAMIARDRLMTAHDPCCGAGHMAGVLEEYFDEVHASDIADYNGNRVADFLDLTKPQPIADWIFINPPFHSAAEFIMRARGLANIGVAALVRVQFLEGQGRYSELFRDFAPHWIAYFTERVAMMKGRWAVNARTASAYAWLFWMRFPTHAETRIGTRAMWIPPCRLALTKHDDAVRFGGCSDLPHEHPVSRRLREIAQAA